MNVLILFIVHKCVDYTWCVKGNMMLFARLWMLFCPGNHCRIMGDSLPWMLSPFPPKVWSPQLMQGKGYWEKLFEVIGNNRIIKPHQFSINIVSIVTIKSLNM